MIIRKPKMKAYKKVWKTLGNNITATDVVNYCLLKALSAKSEDKIGIAKVLLAKAFTPITNKNRLNNGETPYSTLKIHLYNLGCRVAWKGGNNLTIFGQPVETFFETPDQFEAYKELVQALGKFDCDKLYRYYCYIFVDVKSVTPEQAMVQAAHVTMVVGKTMEDKHDPHKIYFQIVELPDEMKMADLAAAHSKFKFHHFIEPDLGNKIVASAINPIPWHEREELKQYKLVEFK